MLGEGVAANLAAMEPTQATAPTGTPHGALASPAARLGTAERRRELVAGGGDVLPLLLGYLPFALTIGVAAGASQDPWAAWAGAILIFGGSAHLSVIEMVGNGSGLAAVVATGLLVNARLGLYSISLQPLWRGTPLRHRLLAAAVVIDPMWLVAERRRARPGTSQQQRAFFVGAAVALAAGWSAAIAAGVFLGSRQEVTALLGFCTPVCLAAIVAPHLRTLAGARCVVVAAVVAVSTSSWPSGTGLLAAMAAGAVAGGWRSGRTAS